MPAGQHDMLVIDFPQSKLFDHRQGVFRQERGVIQTAYKKRFLSLILMSLILRLPEVQMSKAP